MRDALQIMEKRGALVRLQKVRSWASSVFSYAMGKDLIEFDPASLQALPRNTFTAHKSKNFAAITNAEEFAELITKIRSYDGSLITRYGLELVAYTFVRTDELRQAKWKEFNLKNSQWIIPKERMKKEKDHIVPLSRQALKIVEQLKPLTGTSEFVFPNENNASKPMSENTMLYALYRLGYHSRSTVHGFRSSASTFLNEELRFPPDVIERQLAHVDGNKVRAIYNRAEYLPERKKMMQQWADYVDELAVKYNISE
jgi:integrase